MACVVKRTFLEVPDETTTLVSLRGRTQSDSCVAYGCGGDDLGVSGEFCDETSECDAQMSEASTTDCEDNESDSDASSVEMAATADSLRPQPVLASGFVMCYPVAVPVPVVQVTVHQNTVTKKPVTSPPGNWTMVSDTKKDNRTTIVIRNLPNSYTRKFLLDLLDTHGFQNDYRFVYVPMDFKREAGLGYAFVCFEEPAAAQRAKLQLDGFKDWAFPSRKVCETCWSDAIQGVDAYVERYRNSPIMHDTVPDEYKPAIFLKGVRMTYPAPTKQLQPAKDRNTFQFCRK